MFQPLVFGPEATPLVVEPEEAVRDPDLALLSAVAHARGDLGIEAGVAALVASAGLDEEQSRLCADLVLAALGDRAHQALERLMQGYEYQSDFAKKQIAVGKTEGKPEGEAKAVLTILAARRSSISKAARKRILAWRDLSLLDRWVARAVTVASVAELFATPGVAWGCGSRSAFAIRSGKGLWWACGSRRSRPGERGAAAGNGPLRGKSEH